MKFNLLDAFENFPNPSEKRIRKLPLLLEYDPKGWINFKHKRNDYTILISGFEDNNLEIYPEDGGMDMTIKIDQMTNKSISFVLKNAEGVAREIVNISKKDLMRSTPKQPIILTFDYDLR